MAATNRNPHLRLSGLAHALLAAPLGALIAAAAAALALEQPSLERSFAWTADILNSDFRNDIHELSGNVRVTQGVMSIEAGAAQARGLQSDQSRWTFRDAVHIRTAEADLQSDSADAVFVQGQLADARVQGSPAQFAQLNGPAERQVRGQAGVIEYDFKAGVVKLSQQVWFSNGKDEFRGDVVIYNIRDERVQINPDGQASGRVRGIIRQRGRTAPAAPEPTSPPPRAAMPAAGDSENGA